MYLEKIDFLGTYLRRMHNVNHSCTTTLECPAKYTDHAVMTMAQAEARSRRAEACEKPAESWWQASGLPKFYLPRNSGDSPRASLLSSLSGGRKGPMSLNSSAAIPILYQ